MWYFTVSSADLYVDENKFIVHVFRSQLYQKYSPHNQLSNSQCPFTPKPIFQVHYYAIFISVKCFSGLYTSRNPSHLTSMLFKQFQHQFYHHSTFRYISKYPKVFVQRIVQTHFEILQGVQKWLWAVWKMILQQSTSYFIGVSICIVTKLLKTFYSFAVLFNVFTMYPYIVISSAICIFPHIF